MTLVAALTNCPHIGLREPSVVVLFAAHVAMVSPHPGFARGVSHVVRLSPEEEMIRPNARRVVAAVADGHALRDRPDLQLIGHAMRPGGPPPVADLTMPGRLSMARPLPASVRLHDTGPELLRERGAGVVPGASVRAEPSRATPRSRPRGEETASALGAIGLDGRLERHGGIITERALRWHTTCS